MRRHLLIAGTGRAGTSVLVKVLAACGLDTGKGWWNDDANAGMEEDPFAADAPYVLKVPWVYQFTDFLDRVEHVLIPMRSLQDAAASRIVTDMAERSRSAPNAVGWTDWARVPGGALYSMEPLDQERLLAHGFYKMLQAAVVREIPITFVHFPRFVSDMPYLHRCLAPLIAQNETDFERLTRDVLQSQQVRTSLGQRQSIEKLETLAGERYKQSRDQ